MVVLARADQLVVHVVEAEAEAGKVALRVELKAREAEAALVTFITQAHTPIVQPDAH